MKHSRRKSSRVDGDSRGSQVTSGGRREEKNARTSVADSSDSDQRYLAPKEVKADGFQSVKEGVVTGGVGEDRAGVSSLEEGEIEDSQDSSFEVRRSPRKHPSSHRLLEGGGSSSRAAASPVKRRLASPPPSGRSKRSRRSPARAPRSTGRTPTVGPAE